MSLKANLSKFTPVGTVNDVPTVTVAPKFNMVIDPKVLVKLRPATEGETVATVEKPIEAVSTQSPLAPMIDTRRMMGNGDNSKAQNEVLNQFKDSSDEEDERAHSPWFFNEAEIKKQLEEQDKERQRLKQRKRVETYSNGILSKKSHCKKHSKKCNQERNDNNKRKSNSTSSGIKHSPEQRRSRDE